MAYIIGKVVKGEGIGEKQGYPTANLSRQVLVGKKLTRGVYIAKAKIEAKWYKALVVIGVPGVKIQKKGKVEVYLLDYRGNLYGETVMAKVHKKLRKIKKYKNQKDLLKQIHRDVQRARKYFK